MSFLSELTLRDCVANLAWMDLFNAWLVLETLSVTLNMLGGTRSVLLSVKVRLHTELSTLSWAHHNVLTCSSDIGSLFEPASCR